MDIGPVHQDLKLSQGQLAAVFDQAPAAMAVACLDAQGHLQAAAANQALARMLNRQDEQCLSIDLKALLAPDDYQRLSAALTGGQEAALEVSFRGEAPPGLVCRLSLAPLSCSGASSFVLVFTDITAQKDHEVQMLEAAGIEQREDFIATLTHDLTTPIVGANMVLAALLDGTLGALTEPQMELIGKLKTSNQALLKMIHNLLEVYKYESGTESLAPEPVDLVSIVNVSVEDVKPLIENKAQTLHLKFSADTIGIVCDRYAIQRVLVNLLGNAVKFTPTKGTITVCVEDGASHATIKVIDTGSGINPGDQHRLFQRFWQGEPGKRYAAGTGLGLYFCSHVVRAHGGTIICQSSPGSGSTFTVCLLKTNPWSIEPSP